MKHYLMLRFYENALSDQLYAQLQALYEQRAPSEIAGIGKVQVRRNCVARNDNCDVFIEMEMQDEGVLQSYLTQPFHESVMKLTNAHVEFRAAIDVE